MLYFRPHTSHRPRKFIHLICSFFPPLLPPTTHISQSSFKLYSNLRSSPKHKRCRSGTARVYSCSFCISSSISYFLIFSQLHRIAPDFPNTGLDNLRCNNIRARIFSTICVSPWLMMSLQRWFCFAKTHLTHIPLLDDGWWKKIPNKIKK